MSDDKTITVHHEGIGDVTYTYRTTEEIADLICERDSHWAAGRKEEGNAVKAKLKYTALKI